MENVHATIAQFTTLSVKVGEIADDVGELRSDVHRMGSELRTVTDAFQENGQRPGLLTRHALLEQRLERLEQVADRSATQRWQIWMALVGTVMSMLGTALMAIFGH
jgi:hypothetical protein